MEVIDARSVVNTSANDNHYGATVALDQLGLGLLVTPPNAADKIRSTASFMAGISIHLSPVAQADNSRCPSRLANLPT
jgi:hypothetical protein